MRANKQLKEEESSFQMDKIPHYRKIGWATLALERKLLVFLVERFLENSTINEQNKMKVQLEKIVKLYDKYEAAVDYSNVETINMSELSKLNEAVSNFYKEIDRLQTVLYKHVISQPGITPEDLAQINSHEIFISDNRLNIEMELAILDKTWHQKSLKKSCCENCFRFSFSTNSKKGHLQFEDLSMNEWRDEFDTIENDKDKALQDVYEGFRSNTLLFNLEHNIKLDNPVDSKNGMEIVNLDSDHDEMQNLRQRLNRLKKF